MSFAQRCTDPTYGSHAWQAHEAAIAEVTARIQQSGVELVRLGWADLHGVVRSKTLTTPAALRALHSGIGMPSTLILKDSGDRTAYKVFENGPADELPAGFLGGGNVILLPDPHSFQVLPWLSQTGSLRCDAWFQNGQPVTLEPRRLLQTALHALAQHGYHMKCGLEVEFHIYRLTEPVHAVHAANAVHGTLSPAQDPQQADWPGPPPQVALLHPGFHMLSDAWFDQAEPALRIVQRTAQALGLPLTSLEVEMGPSQVEAVFEATDALSAADQMVLFRNAVRQALRREGYHATFMCRPPFPHIMSSGWHLHQSLVDADTGHNAFTRAQAAPHTHPQAAAHTLSDLGTAWLAGLLAHARGMAALCVPTGNGFARFQAHALAPCAAVWGTDNRGAMLRVVGAAGDSATRIENRLGEPAANPYLYIASQVMAGLDGLTQTLSPPLASTTPYASQASERLPTDLNEALSALQTDAALCSSLSHAWVNYYTRIRQSEHQRRTQSPDPQAFDHREYFSRI